MLTVEDSGLKGRVAAGKQRGVAETHIGQGRSLGGSRASIGQALEKELASLLSPFDLRLRDWQCFQQYREKTALSLVRLGTI